MSDPFDSQKVENTEAKDPGSFASWPRESRDRLPPRIRRGHSRGWARSVARMTPPHCCGKRREEDDHTPTGDRVSREMPHEAAMLADASDNDDEPTTVFSTLFPDLLPKKVTPSPSFPPPPQPEGKHLTPTEPTELMKAEPVLDLAALEQQGAIQATSDDDDDDKRRKRRSPKTSRTRPRRKKPRSSTLPCRSWRAPSRPRRG